MFRGRLLIAAMCALLCMFALAGCGQQGLPNLGANSQANDTVASNMQYMSAVNQTSKKLSDQMMQFAEAVSRSDLVSMRTQADNAYQIIGELEALEAPEGMVQLREGYVNACGLMREALDKYIKLYEDMNDSGKPFDYSKYDGRIKEVEGKYKEAIGQLEAADKTAISLQGNGESQQSSDSDSSSSSDSN